MQSAAIFVCPHPLTTLKTETATLEYVGPTTQLLIEHMQYGVSQFC